MIPGPKREGDMYTGQRMTALVGIRFIDLQTGVIPTKNCRKLVTYCLTLPPTDMSNFHVLGKQSDELLLKINLFVAKEVNNKFYFNSVEGWIHVSQLIVPIMYCKSI